MRISLSLVEGEWTDAKPVVDTSVKYERREEGMDS